MTIIKKCESRCQSEYQDRRFGVGNRAHNQTKQNKPANERGWRCTVCGQPKRG